MDKLELKEEDFIGKGNERICYAYPTDNHKAVKVSYNQNIGRSKQTETEISYYKLLLKKRPMNWKHLPKFYGEIKTNKGDGFIIELIKDYDGQVSKSFAYYINKFGVETYNNQLQEYKEFFINYQVIFNYGMMPKNILLRKNSEVESHLVLIDGLGDITYFTFLNKIPYFARKKINRRWNKFVAKYLSGKKVKEA
ncbi:MAG: hypothetical protein COB42_06940 [Sulfurimonas sp.]|nr:MAG: hypothetical protein COB42_06940 [Sulfurimonas sp.]